MKSKSKKRGNIQRGRAPQHSHGLPVKKIEEQYNKATRNATPSKGAKYSRITHKPMNTGSSTKPKTLASSR